MQAEKILKEYFGYDEFRGAQKDIITALTEENRNVLAIMPTGSGKSLCYQIPALMFEGGTLVISPLIALMQDQVDALRKKNIPASFINASVSRTEKEKRLNNFLAGKLKMLYVTPERFRNKDFATKIKNAGVSLLAVDEAHCISEWGHDFRPDYSRIAEFRAMIGNPLTIALTATATPDVKNDIVIKLGLTENEIDTYHQGIDRPNLRLEVADVYDEKAKFETIINTIKKYNGSGIIYFALIKTLEYYKEELQRRGYNFPVYHGKLNDRERKKIQRNFLNKENQIILATNAFGMGIDKPDIRFVIHAEMPGSLEAYYQEIGRAGRDGKPSACILLYNQDDLYTQMEFVKWSNPNAEYYHRLYELLKNNPEQANSEGIDYLREQLSFKNRNDFRLETALGLMDRYHVTEGSIENKNLTLTGELPESLTDDAYIAEKLKNDNMKLLAVVNYFKESSCRRNNIEHYFGFPNLKKCGNCDLCN